MRKNSVAATAPTPDMADQDWEKLELESAYIKKCRITWAALVKCVYERAIDIMESAKHNHLTLQNDSDKLIRLSVLPRKTTIKTVCFDTGTPYAAEQRDNSGGTMKIIR
jgi:hypothetical protein